MTEAGFDFEVRPVDVVEVGPRTTRTRGGRSERMPVEKPWRPWGLRWNQHGEAILTADTILVLRGCWIGKPRDRGEAMQILTDLAGQVHQVATAVALVGPVEAGFFR